MRFETYLKYRKEFLDNYNNSEKNELGFVRLECIKVRIFDKFIYLFSYDFIDTCYNSLVNSVDSNSYKIKNSRYVNTIKINSNKSMFDKYDELYIKALKHYK